MHGSTLVDVSYFPFERIWHQSSVKKIHDLNKNQIIRTLIIIEVDFLQYKLEYQIAREANCVSYP